MGITACFTSIPADELQRFRGNPDELEAFLYPEGGDDDPPNYLDLDKAWHGLHYLFTGEAEGGAGPLSLSILGGTEFGDEMDYGPARFLSAEEVSAVAQALAPLTASALRERFNPPDMEARQIYPDIVWVRDGDDAFDYMLPYLSQLQQFYAAAARRGDAVIQWLS